MATVKKKKEPMDEKLFCRINKKIDKGLKEIPKGKKSSFIRVALEKQLKSESRWEK